MIHFRPMIGHLQRFGRDESGSVSVEAMLLLPILMWAYLGTFVFFDAFRSQSTNIKAAYVVGDTLSRETGFVTPEYMDSLFTLHQFLVDTDQNVQLRVSVFTYDEDEDDYLVRWSQTRGGAPTLTNAMIAGLRDRLPDMPDAENAILTETWVSYSPSYSVGIGDFNFENLVVTRPRFAGQLCWNTLNNGTQTTATC